MALLDDAFWLARLVHWPADGSTDYPNPPPPRSADAAPPPPAYQAGDSQAADQAGDYAFGWYSQIDAQVAAQAAEAAAGVTITDPQV